MARRKLKEAIQAAQEMVVDEAEQGDEELKTWKQIFVKQRVLLSKDTHGIYSVQFSPDGLHLAVGFGNGAVQVINARTGQLFSDVSTGHRMRQAVTSLCYHPTISNLLVTASADGNISIYNTESKKRIININEDKNEINTMDFCLDGSVFATAGKDRNIRLYDSKTNQLLKILNAPNLMMRDEMTVLSGHSRRIFALRFHPDEYHLFATGGWDDSIKIWDKRLETEALRVMNGPHICGPGLDLRGTKMLTGSWVPNNALQLWDFRNLQLETNLLFPVESGQNQYLYAARFCNNQVSIAGGSGTASAHAINYQTNQDLGEIRLGGSTVQTVDSCLGGHLIAVAGVGGNLHIAALM